MIYKKIELTESAYLETYIANKVTDYTRKAILVIPGGGYAGLATEREGEQIALAFMAHGYNAFVLNYSIKEQPFPQQLIEASLAMKHIRDNCEEYGIDANKVFTVGFSAGGHLAGSLGTMWHKKEIYDAIDMPYAYNKPNGMMLIYPVINRENHYLSLENLLMGDVTEEKLSECEIDKAVDENTVPAFIMHTVTDQIVDVRGALDMANALTEQGISYEMHIYPDGPHGMALANEITRCGNEKWCEPAIAKWVEHAVYWAEKFGE